MNSENKSSSEGSGHKPQKGTLGKIAALGIVVSPFIAGIVRSGWRSLLSEPRTVTHRDFQGEPKAGSGSAQWKSSLDVPKAESSAAASQPASENELGLAVPAPLPEGWHRPRPEKTPHPTYAPATVALGILGLLWGIMTTPIISLVGGVLFVIGLASWIGGLRRE